MKEWDENCVKLDRTFANEIKKQANGDGSREAKFAYRAKVKEVSGMLSTTKVEEIFDECIKKHGRVPVAICVAATIIERRDRVQSRAYMWAKEVMKLYVNAPPDKSYACIDDGLHPTRIEDYARSLMQLTTEEW